MQNLNNYYNNKNRSLALMGITQWSLQDKIYTSPNHTLCLFNLTSYQTFNVGQTTFLIKLYQAIEKLLKLPSSTQLIIFTRKIDLNLTKINLYFNAQVKTPTLVEKSPILSIHLPDVSQCARTPEIKRVLWELLKKHIFLL